MRLRSSTRAQIVALGLLIAGVAAAEPLPAPAPPTLAVAASELGPLAESALHPALERHTLASGLRVVLDPLPGSGTVTFCAAQDVGWADEAEAELGYARVAAAWLADLDSARRLVEERGGTTRHFVGLDRSLFCASLPAGEVALGVWLQARRWTATGLTAAQFTAARRRAEAGLQGAGLDDVRRRGEERLLSLSLQGSLRTERSALASLRALGASDREPLEVFARRHFRAERGALAVSGDFESTELLAALGTALAALPPRTPATRGDGLGAPGRQLSDRFAALREEAVTTPLVLVGWAAPPRHSVDAAALELALRVLADGPGSSLHEELVARGGLARSVRAFATDHRGAGVVGLELQLTASAAMPAVERAVSTAARRLAGTGPSSAALARAKAARLTELLARLDSGATRAAELAALELIAGDARLLASERARYEAVTPADVKRVVAARLTETLRTVIEMHPPGWPTGGAARASRLVHIVEPGDTLIGIAARYGVTAAALAKENKLQTTKPIFPGQKLRLPSGAKDRGGKKGSGTAAKSREVVVKKGDTLSEIAKRHGVSTVALARANGLDPKRAIRIGQRLVLPSAPKAAESGRTGATEPSGSAKAAGRSDPRSTGSATTPRVHVVKAGETLSGIAYRYKVGTAALARANGLDPKRPIRPGQRLVIPEKTP